MAKKRRSSSWLAMLAVLVILGIALGPRLAVWLGGDHGAETTVGGPFTLIGGDGQPVNDTQFRGKWMLIYFGYTFCPDVCPTELSAMATALDQLPAAQRDKLVPIFITVDPDRDTAAVVRDYAAAFHPQMVGLTGSAQQIDAVKKLFRVYSAKAKSDDPAAYTVDHSSIVYLMGPDGRYVTHFAYGTNPKDMAATLAKTVQ